MAQKLTPAQKAAKTRAATRKARLQEAVKAWEQRKKATASYAKRSAAAKKGWETRRVIERGKKVIKALRTLLDNWSPMPYWSEAFTAVKRADKNALQRLLDTAINTFGEREVAIRLEKDADLNMEAADAICYHSNQENVENAKAHLTTVLNGGPMDANQAKKTSEEFTRNEWDEANAELDILLGK